MCGSKVGGLSTEGIDLTKETVIQGVVTRDGEPVGGAYVRLLDTGGDFVAEVQASATGDFRFFAAPGRWSLRALAAGGAIGHTIVTAGPGLNEANVSVTNA